MHEKEGAAAPVDQAVNHLRPYIHTEKPDHKNAKSVSQNGKWDDKGDERKPAPSRLQE